MNAILGYFERRLSVPRVYLNASWKGQHTDILAINRDGVGDVHVVECKRPQTHAVVSEEQWAQWLEKLKGLPAQYKYLAIVWNGSVESFVIPATFFELSFAPDGLGRVGLFLVTSTLDKEPTAELKIKPERFRAFVAKDADEFVRTHEADWELRPDPITEETHV